MIEPMTLRQSPANGGGLDYSLEAVTQALVIVRLAEPTSPQGTRLHFWTDRSVCIRDQWQSLPKPYWMERPAKTTASSMQGWTSARKPRVCRIRQTYEPLRALGVTSEQRPVVSKPRGCLQVACWHISLAGNPDQPMQSLDWHRRQAQRKRRVACEPEPHISLESR